MASNNDWLIMEIAIIRTRLLDLELRTLRREIEIIFLDTVVQTLRDHGIASPGVEESLASANVWFERAKITYDG
jgi:hypothetical protein